MKADKRRNAIEAMHGSQCNGIPKRLQCTSVHLTRPPFSIFHENLAAKQRPESQGLNNPVVAGGLTF